MSDDPIRQAREMLAGVTEGPWHLDMWRDGSDGGFAVLSPDGKCLCRPSEWPSNAAESAVNARFIAWARTGVPALIAELEASRG